MTGSLRVAVCTNRPPARLAECLAALRKQVPADLLAVVASGADADGLRALAAVAPGPLLHEPRLGLSHARNRALRWAEAGDVLAFVDDDAMVEPRWYAALSACWKAAPASIGCIGGPIRPRFEIPPPAWLSPPLLPTLTVLDLGATARDLDPSVSTVYGANVSFRVAPLRAVGGFDPSFGHRGDRISFSEEDEAQRALARIGFGTRYTPHAAVCHVIPAERLTRRAFLHRRFAYGATLGRRGARSRRLAARQLVTSGLGAAVAVATRAPQRLAMERVVRAAENAGVLAGTLIRRRF